MLQRTYDTPSTSGDEVLLLSLPSPTLYSLNYTQVLQACNFVIGENTWINLVDL